MASPNLSDVPVTEFEWFDVVFDKVFVKKAPDREETSWGWLLCGQRVQVLTVHAIDAKGLEWVELTAKELLRSCQCKDEAARGFALIDGEVLGLTRFLRGPLPAEELQMQREEQELEVQCIKRRLTLQFLSGKCLAIDVNVDDTVREVRERAALILGIHATELRFSHREEVIPLDAYAVNYLGMPTNVIVVVKRPLAISTSPDDCSLSVWDLEDLSCQGKLKGHTKQVWSIVADFTLQRALSGSVDSSLYLWDLECMQSMGILHGHIGEVCALSADFAKGLAVSGSGDSNIYLWSLEDMARWTACMTANRGAVWALFADFQEMLVLSGYQDGVAEVWDFNEGAKDACRGTLMGHDAPIQAVHADFHAELAMSGCEDGSLRIWDLKQMRCLRHLQPYAASPAVWALQGVSRQPIKSWLALSGSFGEALHIWDLSKRSAEILENSAGASAIAVDSSGHRVIIGRYTGELHVWDMKSRASLGTIRAHSGVVRAVCA